MQESKIGVVEDELIIADSIRSMLLGMRYSVPEPCSTYEAAIKMLHTQKPDLVLLDINLSDREQDGIAVARYIRTHLQLPFIFLTANSDSATLARAKTVRPNAFLVKPFMSEELHAAIEIAMHNFYSTQSSPPQVEAQGTILVKDGGFTHKVAVEDILFIQSDHVYVSVHTAQRKYLVRASLQYYLEQLPQDLFIQIHRSFVVNRLKIDKVGPTSLQVGDYTLPISRKYRDAVLEKW
jgi:DNA-binding LytR/AlgR family response regulator